MFLRYGCFTILSLLTCIAAFAQQLPDAYYSSGWKKCDPSKACYLAKTVRTDSGYYRTDYFINNGALQMAALYEDSACKIMNGYGNYFYANGYPARKARMLHGKKEGVEVGYHDNGQMADSGFYHNGQPEGDKFSWHYNGYMADSVTHVNDSSFVHVSWFDDGGVAAAGREINGKKTGPWVFYHHNGNRAAKEVYENGKRITIQHYDESGNEIAVDTSRKEHAATLKGGIPTWQKYLERSLRWPYGYTFPNVTQVLLEVELTINEEGSITDVYVINPLHPVFDKEAYNVISKGPKWIPAVQHNRTVKYRFRQGVTFAME